MMSVVNFLLLLLFISLHLDASLHALEVVPVNGGFVVVPDPMLQPVLPRVEVLLVDLLLDRLELLFDHLVDLLLGQLLPIEPHHLLCILDDLNARLLHEELLLRDGELAGLLDELRGDHLLLVDGLVVEGLLEVDLDVGLHDADLVLRLAVDDVDEVVPALVVNVDGVAFHQARVVSELLFEDGLRIRKVDEGRLMGLQYDELALLEVHRAEDDFGSLLQVEVVHHPVGQVAAALLCRELKHSRVGLLAHLRVAQHEEHGVCDAQTGELVERGRREDDYS